MKHEGAYRTNRQPGSAEKWIRNALLRPDDTAHMIRAFEARRFEVSILTGDSADMFFHRTSSQQALQAPEMQLTGYSEKLGYVSVLFKGGDVRIRARGSFVAKELQHELWELLYTRRSILRRIYSWEGWPVVSLFALGAEFVLLFLAPIRCELPRLLHIALWVSACLWPAVVLGSRYRQVHPDIMCNFTRTPLQLHLRR